MVDEIAVQFRVVLNVSRHILVEHEGQTCSDDCRVTAQSFRLHRERPAAADQLRIDQMIIIGNSCAHFSLSSGFKAAEAPILNSPLMLTPRKLW